MSFAAKVVITIVVCFVLVAVGSVGLLAYLWSRHSGELLEAGRKQTEQGMVFGRDTDESGCLNEAVVRYKANRGLAGSMAAGIFAQSCWRTSSATAGFCDGVPSPYDFVRAGRWQAEQTKKAGIDPFGGQVFGQQQAYCAEARPRQHPEAVTPR